jgi:hypothetical protein
MKAAPFLLLALGASSAFACANYFYCHCYDSNGLANDNATQSIFTNWYGADTRPTGPNGAQECSGLGDGATVDNCDFRKLCLVAFATGSDSSCREKCFIAC